MNSLQRFLLGLLSCLLLAAGLSRAADRFDPMTKSLSTADEISLPSMPTAPCSDPCVEPLR